MDKWSVIQYLEERAEDFYKLSDKIWENAETRFKEKQSVKDYVAFLENEGFKVTVGDAGLKTGFHARWGSGKPVIGFLGEYDALAGLSQKAGVSVKEPLAKEGNGHGCGHNLLGVGALMGVWALSIIWKRKKNPEPWCFSDALPRRVEAEKHLWLGRVALISLIWH